MSKWLSISRTSLDELKNGNYTNIEWHTSSVPKMKGNFNDWNMELIVMPYYDNEYGKGIFLKNVYNGGPVARFYRTPVMIPEFLLPLDRSGKTIEIIFDNVIALNLYSMLSGKYDESYVEYGFNSGVLNVDRLLSNELFMDYSGSYMLALYDEEKAYDNMFKHDGCTVTLVYCPIVTDVYDSSVWAPVPKDIFMEYYESDFPNDYIGRFTEFYSYDPKSQDSRMNKRDKQVIASVLKNIENVK